MFDFDFRAQIMNGIDWGVSLVAHSIFLVRVWFTCAHAA